MLSFPPLQRALSFLRELNPLWILAPAVLILLAIATASLRHQVDHSERLQQRLTGTALVDALKAYSDATPSGTSTRPASLAELTDDNRAGTHRNWLDAVSAESLADRSTWKLMLDDQGRLQGAQLRSEEGKSRRWLPAWLAGGPGKEDSSAVYALADAGPAPEQAVAAVKPAPMALPQPVLPDTPLEPLAQQAAAERSPPPAKDRLLAAAPGDPRAAATAALDPAAKPSAKVPATPAPGQPSRILAGLEARQVLRLSGGDGSDAPVLTPRRSLPPAIPVPPGGRTAAVGAVAPGGSTSGTSTAGPAGASSAASNAAALGSGSTASPGAAARPGTGASTSPAASAARPAGVASAPRKPSAQGMLKHVAPTASAAAEAKAAPANAVPPLPGPPVMPAPIAVAKPIAPVRASPPARAASTARPPAADPAGTASAPASVAVPAASTGAPLQAPAPVPATSAPAEVRMDTVIYEDSAASAAAASGDGPKTDCRALAGDSIECDTFEDTDPALYQRCYQSLSERINACIAGEPIPSLVTR